MESEAAPEQAVILRVIAGEQKGSSIELENRGGYSIGASDECSVVLVGDGLAPIHIETVFLDGALTVLDCEDDVTIDGSPHASTPFTVHQGQLVSFAGITVAIGAEGTDWDELAERADQRRRQEAEAKAKEVKRVRKARSGNLILLLSAVGLVALVGSLGWWLIAEEEGTAAATSAAPASPSGSSGRDAAAVAASDAEDAADDAGADDAPAAEDQNLIDASGLEELLKSRPDYASLAVVGQLGGNSATPIIKGIVEEPSVLDRLRRATTHTDLRPVYNVVVRDRLLDDAKVALREHDVALIFDLSFADQRLVMSISGLARDFRSPDDLSGIISEDMPLIDDIKVTARSADRLLDDLRDLAASQPELGGLTFDISGGRLEVVGNVLGNFADDFKVRLGTVLDGYKPNSLEVDDAVVVGPRFDGEVVSVLISGTSRFAVIKTVNGDEFRALVGSELADGLVIKAINRDHLLVEEEGSEFYLPIM